MPRERPKKEVVVPAVKIIPSEEQRQQEIQDYLEGLNRTSKSWASTAGSERTKAIGIANYLKWFKARNIAIYEDEKTHVWKLDESQQGDEKDE